MAGSSGQAAAKINLALHVTGQRADGYHLLDSLVVFADIHDKITARMAPNLSVEVTASHFSVLREPAITSTPIPAIPPMAMNGAGCPALDLLARMVGESVDCDA